MGSEGGRFDEDGSYGEGMVASLQLRLTDSHESEGIT